LQRPGVTLLRIVTRPQLLVGTTLFCGEDVAGFYPWFVSSQTIINCVSLLRIVTRPQLFEDIKLFYGEDVAGEMNYPISTRNVPAVCK
jgi:hypothetical protein